MTPTPAREGLPELLALAAEMDMYASADMDASRLERLSHSWSERLRALAAIAGREAQGDYSGRLIEAAEKYADPHENDEHHDVKTLVLNAYYAGAAWANRDALPHPQPEKWQHKWSDDGERCVHCGDKDWMGGECGGPRTPPPPSDAAQGEIVDPIDLASWLYRKLVGFDPKTYEGPRTVMDLRMACEMLPKLRAHKGEGNG